MVSIIPVDVIINAICKAGKNEREFSVSDLKLEGKIPLTTLYHRIEKYILDGTLDYVGDKPIKGTGPGIREKRYKLNMDFFEKNIGEIVSW